MKIKFIISLIIISAFLLFSMQLCSLIFGNKPTVSITSPTSNATITASSLEVKGTINDLDGDASKVKVWIEDTSIIEWDHDVSSGNFCVSLDISSLQSGTYIVLAQGYDANNNQSDIVSKTFTYSPGGGGGSIVNLLLNGNFKDYGDHFYGTYNTLSLITDFLNNLNGDYLANWMFHIYADYALDNCIGIDLDGGSIRYYSTQSDYDGNAKFEMTQSLSQTHYVTPKTKLKITFKINYYEGGSNPGEGPLKIYIDAFAVSTRIASFSTQSGSSGNNIVGSLNKGQQYTYDLYLFSDCGVALNTAISSIYICVNCHAWDVTIYEIALYEEP